VGYRLWCNKLWNAIKFAMMNLGTDFVPSASVDVEALELGSQWILSMLNRAVAGTVECLEKWELSNGKHLIRFRSSGIWFNCSICPHLFVFGGILGCLGGIL
jgi:valyl-tRNA synthetase